MEGGRGMKVLSLRHHSYRTSLSPCSQAQQQPGKSRKWQEPGISSVRRADIFSWKIHSKTKGGQWILFGRVVWKELMMSATWVWTGCVWDRLPGWDEEAPAEQGWGGGPHKASGVFFTTLARNDSCSKIIRSQPSSQHHTFPGHLLHTGQCLEHLIDITTLSPHLKYEVRLPVLWYILEIVSRTWETQSKVLLIPFIMV